jgi:hypothetical protein
MSTMDQIDTKLDRITEALGDINVTLARQEDMGRRVGLLETQMEPVVKHVTMAQGVAKFLGLLATIGGLLAGIWQASK